MLTELGEVRQTDRGFEIIEFHDRNVKTCTLQASSVTDDDRIESPGTSAVWLGVGDARMHLNREQVSALMGHLHRWLYFGSFAKERPATD